MLLLVVLKAYGGTFYSYGHKESVNTITQSENSKAIEYPKKGEKYPPSSQEIDLMKYFHGAKPYDFYDRRVANEKDVIGLVWLTKLELK
ncbi:hypothetical protein PL373_06880 [Tenacibaculum maritimum]|nr:hypothetical protein [Tenacibaculum maritimum]MDB0600868.1 hypothetical protein [Tenacibaculum maritimum]MDB0612012.1 hypothetical protein [Tenacibaculum maritimum]